MRASAIVLCLVLGAGGPVLAQPAGSTVVEAPPLPPALVGNWVVTRSVGEQPMLLEVPSAAALVGKRVTVGSDRFQAWDVFAGTVTQVRRFSGTMREYLDSLQSPRPAVVPEPDRHFDFYLLATRDCTTHGKPLDGCPAVFTLARDPQNGEVALVTLPAGLATLGPAGSPK